MISVSFLFEREPHEPLPRAEAVTATRDNYINERINTLKKAFARGQIRAADYQAQLKQFMHERVGKDRNKQGYYIV